MEAKLNEKMLRQILTGSISEVVDPNRNFKKADCEMSVEIAGKVIETLKELKIYNPE